MTLIIMLYGALSSHGYGRALALGGATPVGAALVAGGTAVPTFYFVAVGAGVALLAGFLDRSRQFHRSTARPVPGLAALVAFAAWSTLVTLVAPLLFDGLSVSASGGAEARLAAGIVTSSNLAQIVYLVLGLCVVVYLARAREAGPELIGLAAGLATLLSFWAYLGATFAVPFPTGLFDNSPTFVFIDTLPGGAPRVRGIFSEPAGLAMSSLVTVAYMASRVHQVAGLRRVGVIIMIALAAYLGAVSTSASFVVAAVALIVTSGVVFVVRVTLRRGSIGALTLVGTAITVMAATLLLPRLVGWVQRVVSSKVDSSSYDERSGADARSYGILLDTFGMGAGLGSNRPSSFLATLVSTTGLVGTALFIAAVVTVLRAGSKVPEYRPVAWALISVLIVKVISGPDLSDSSGILWMSIGLLARASLRDRVPRPEPSLSPGQLPTSWRETRSWISPSGR
ncbi:hypothetical protein GCM10011589_18850 [Modestobacter marinus]|uniref:Uncharacterized protein n=1 Tax=Modestobacter marinus TaxID=477641 RepID=A0ABQ2FX25_9ACTN|nr:hypothetical protein GCM10011589_18850 [Modestobacter marinus]